MSFTRGTDLAEALRRVVGGEVRFDSYTRHLFSRDASMYTIEPVGVVFPRDAADVAAVVATAAEFGVPVLPRGAGTSLAGQTVGHAIVMCPAWSNATGRPSPPGSPGSGGNPAATDWTGWTG
jgi:hypothetical protein